MNVTPIEIKVNLDGDIAEALIRLGCADDAALERHIWFAEPRVDDLGGAPTLLSNSIVIRLRSGVRDDLTVMVRPCERSRLAGRWSAPFTDGASRYRIDRDWCATRQLLSASVLSRRPPGSMREAVTDGLDLTAALDTAQRRFLVSCTPPGVAVDRLVAVGPVASSKWTNVALDAMEVDVERWHIAELDLLELSLRVTPVSGETDAELRDRAAAGQRRFDVAVRDRGLRIATGETKTHRVLTTLTARSAREVEN